MAQSAVARGAVGRCAAIRGVSPSWSVDVDVGVEPWWCATVGLQSSAAAGRQRERVQERANIELVGQEQSAHRHRFM
jgi:hypothetical protein